MSENSKLNTGILKDVGPEIDTWLNSFLPSGWKKGRAPHFSNKSTYLALLKQGLNESVDFSRLIERIDARIQSTLDSVTPREPSPENWRFERHPDISDENESPEVCLEREIVRQDATKWANQSPVASGLIDKDSDKGRHVDLVREVEQGEVYDLIELKWASGNPWGADNPFFAAMEILCYGLIYLQYRQKFPRSVERLLRASTIHLRVLAPEGYYSGTGANHMLAALESQLSQTACKRALQAGITMDFRYLKIPHTPLVLAYPEVARAIIQSDAVGGMPPAFG